MKDVLIINPGYPNPMGGLAALEPPVWAGMYASYARNQGYDTNIHDCQIKPLDSDRFKHYDEVWIIAMGNNPSASSTPKMPDVIKISQMAKQSGAKVMIGGLHPWALPELTLKETGADGILDKIPHGFFPAWDLLSMQSYRAHNWHCLDGTSRSHYASIYTSFGCPFKCSFCNIHTAYKDSKVMYYEPKRVVAELRYLAHTYGIRNIKLCDELFTANSEHAAAICLGLIAEDLHLNIWAYARVGTVTPRLLELMKRANINWLGYGFESFEPSIRLGVNKQYRTEADTIKMTRDAGINIMANFMFGLPGDTEKSMSFTLYRAMSYNFEYVNFYVAMPYPGSDIWDDSLSYDWSRYSQFSPDRLGDKTAIKFRDFAFKEYFTNPAYLKMIKTKFGEQAVTQINQMLGVK